MSATGMKLMPPPVDGFVMTEARMFDDVASAYDQPQRLSRLEERA